MDNSTTPLVAEPVDTRLRTQLIAVSSVLTGFGTIVVALRMLSRARVLHSIGKDDWVMLVAWAFTVVYLSLVAVGTTYGQGLHVKDWKQEWFDPGFKSILAIQAVYYFCVYFVKVSILFFYLRLASVPAFKRLVWGTVVLLTVFLVACIMVVFLQCIPLSQFWDLTVLPEDKRCINTTAFFYSTSLFNIVTDVWILVLPLKLLWRVQRPFVQKLALIGVFAVGSFACVASCVRLYTIEIFTKSDDPLYDSVPVNIWSFIEINVAIFTASVPAIKALFYKPASRTENGSHDYSSGSRNKSSKIAMGSLNSHATKSKITSKVTGPMHSLNSFSSTDEMAGQYEKDSTNHGGIQYRRDLDVTVENRDVRRMV